MERENFEINNKEAIINEALTERARMYEQYGQEFYNLIINYAHNIKIKYPDDYDSCLLYHILIGSSIKGDDSPTLDFPGEDSVLLFLKNAAAKLEKQNASVN